MYVEMLGDVGLDVMQERQKFLMPVSGFTWLTLSLRHDT
jgi:hypothetical protein